jgi:predicted RNA-binding Zn-ribbon protein involved in translation (DUF1610 family)
MFKIIEYKNADEKNYGYAVCKCTFMNEGIEVPRPEHTKYIRFNCPRCGENLGIMLRGKKDIC